MVDILKKEKFITRLKKRLGWPKIDVELDKTQFEEAIETALNKLSEFFPKTVSEQISLVDNTSVYEMATVERIYGVAGFVAQNDYLSLGLNFGEDVAWKIFGGTYGYEGNIRSIGRFTEDYVTRMGTFEMAKNVFRTRKECRLWEEPNKVIVLPEPSTTELAYVFLHVKRGLSDLRFEDEDWVMKYALAYCKAILGEIRSKYGDLPTPMGTMTLNGETLKSEGREEITALEEQLGRMSKGTVIDGYYPF